MIFKPFSFLPVIIFKEEQKISKNNILWFSNLSFFSLSVFSKREQKIQQLKNTANISDKDFLYS